MSIGPMSAPHFLVPVMAAAQEVNVAKAGEEPDPAHPIQEDMRLFDPDLVDKSGEHLRKIVSLGEKGLGGGTCHRLNAATARNLIERAVADCHIKFTESCAQQCLETYCT